MPRRLVIGITGASGTIYAIRLLEALRDLPADQAVETHLVMSRAAEMTLAYETDIGIAAIEKLAHRRYPIGDIGAAIASGSFRALGMIVAPCSVKTLAEIATGVTGNLLSRAADVMLKERRRLVLMVRETPLHSGHLRNMLQVSEMGAIIAPPVPAFYTRPASIDEIVDQTVGRVLDLFDLESPLVRRWGDDIKPGRKPVA